MNARTYTVTGQNQVRGLGPGGQLVDMYEISYRGPGTITGSVRVPVEAATPANVDQLIRTRLDMQLQLAQLGDTPAG